MNKLAHLFLTALAIAIMTMLAAIAWSQPKMPTGTITVTVLDSLTKQPLFRSPVQISLSKGSFTNSAGMAILLNVRPDTYTLSAKYTGYKSKYINGVTVLDGDSLHYTILLSLRNDSTMVTTMPIKPSPTAQHEFRIRGGRASDSIVDTRDPPVEDPVQGQQRWGISGFSTVPTDTTSRVYRVYYRK